MTIQQDTRTESVEASGRRRASERPRRPRQRAARSFGEPGAREQTVRYVILVLMVLVTVGPFLWELSTSFKSQDEDIYSQNPSFIPQHPTFGNYVNVFTSIPVFGYIGNSVFVAVLQVGGNIIFSTFAGFALSRLKWRLRPIVLGLFLSTLILPGEATIISQFVLVRDLGFADSLIGVALPGMVSALNVLLMYNAFRQIPDEIDQAAIVDGANAWQRFRLIGLPAVTGTIAVIAIFTFIGAWDDFLWPLIVLNTPGKYTLTVGLQYLSGTFANDQRMVAAGTMIAFIPIAIVFGVLQRFFFKGVEEGGVKG